MARKRGNEWIGIVNQLTELNKRASAQSLHEIASTAKSLAIALTTANREYQQELLNELAAIVENVRFNEKLK